MSIAIYIVAFLAAVACATCGEWRLGLAFMLICCLSVFKKDSK